jgi:serine protease SohB
MYFLSQYGLFLIKTITLIVGFFIVVIGVIAIASKNKSTGVGRLYIKDLNEKYDAMRSAIEELLLNKVALKQAKKAKKQAEKAKDKQIDTTDQKSIFVVNFNGDVRAQAVSALREEITAILTIAKPQDEVFAIIESPGGLVHAYGLAASQLLRIKQHKLKLTVCVDRIAASGGYLMACVADKILAAPFAILGSIGVVGQLPNFNRLLKEHHVDYEQLTAGEYKRTLTMLGENTEKGRAKFQEQIQETHNLFKDFVKTHRAQLDMNQIATGEYWYGSKALELKLIDDIATSDDYLLAASKNAKLLLVAYKPKVALTQKLMAAANFSVSEFQHSLKNTVHENQYFL